MAIIRCPECGHEISDKAPFCPSCGVAIAGKVTECPECGNVYFSEMSECPKCHHKTERKQIENQETEHQKVESREDANSQTTAQSATNGETNASAQSAINGETNTSSQSVANGENNASAQSVANVETDANSSANRPNFFSSQTVAGNRPMQNVQVSDVDDVEQSSHGSSRNNKIIIIVAVVVTLLLAGICYYFYHSAQVDSERQAYEYALSSKDPQVLQRYLDNYTDAPDEHRDSIQAHLSLLQQIDQDWTNAVVSGSKSALQQYIEQHPDSPYKLIAVHKIDSIDWSMAQQTNTVEAVEAYLEQHPDGEHVDEAQTFIKTLNSKSLQPEERQMVVSIFNTYLQSLNNRDEDALTSVVSPLLNSFLGKSNATRSDVVTYMHKIYKADVVSMKWESVGDYTISKKEVGDQQYNYSVSFSAVQSVTSTDNTTTDNKFRINATINNEGRICELGMVQING